MKSTVIGARDGAPATKEIVISSGLYGRADDDEEEDSSNAETAYLADLHLAYIAFDILYIQSEVRSHGKRKPKCNGSRDNPTMQHCEELPNCRLLDADLNVHEHIVLWA